MTEPLPSVEEKLRVLDAALVALERPGLRATEVSRLHNIIMGVKVYQQLFADFVNYRALESEVLELRRQLAAEKKSKLDQNFLGPSIPMRFNLNGEVFGKNIRISPGVQVC